MNSRFAPMLAALLLAIPLFCFAAPDAAAPAAGNEAESQALKLAGMKLAALAKEAQTQNGDGKEAAAPPAKKTQKRPARKIRLSKSQQKLPALGDPKGQKIVGRRLTEAEVRGILATTRDFTGSDLSGMNLVGMDLAGAKFNRANLHLANLERADLAETDLELADLTGANLRGASLNQARLRGTRLDGTRMDGALWIDRTICRKGSVGSCIE